MINCTIRTQNQQFARSESETVKALAEIIANNNKRDRHKRPIGLVEAVQNLPAARHKDQKLDPLAIQKVAIQTAIDRGHDIKLLNPDAVRNVGLGYLLDDDIGDDILSLLKNAQTNKEFDTLQEAPKDTVFKVPVIMADSTIPQDVQNGSEYEEPPED